MVKLFFQHNGEVKFIKISSRTHKRLRLYAQKVDMLVPQIIDLIYQEFNDISEGLIIHYLDMVKRTKMHFVSASCRGEKCQICKLPATHKIGEEILSDDLSPVRHNLTTYVCCEHFRLIMGPAVPCPRPTN